MPEVSGTWPTRRLRFFLAPTITGERRGSLLSAADITFLPMEAVGEQGELDTSNIREITEVQSGYTLFFDGDVLVAKITPCFENGKGALVRGLAGGVGFGSTEFHVLTPNDELDGRFLYYVSVSRPFRKIGEASMIGAAGQKRVPETFVRDYRIPLFSVERQRSIAKYLDRETARLDALIAAKQRMLRLLAEKGRALITRAVTRGIDPDARLRDSGIEWLGDVPAHWKTVPLRFLVDISGGATPNTAKSDFWDGDIPWVSPKDMKRDIIDDAEEHVTPAALSASALQMIEPGAVLIVVRGMILAHSFPAAVTTAPVTINQDMKALCCREDLDPYFLRDFFKGITRYIVSLAETSAHGTRKLESRVLGHLEIGLPPLSEQRDIVAYIALQSNKLKDLAFATTQSIDLIKERRAALIAAAVTGQLSVPELAQPAPSEEEMACSSTT